MDLVGQLLGFGDHPCQAIPSRIHPVTADVVAIHFDEKIGSVYMSLSFVPRSSSASLVPRFFPPSIAIASLTSDSFVKPAGVRTRLLARTLLVSPVRPFRRIYDSDETSIF